MGFAVSDRTAYIYESDNKRRIGNFNNEKVARGFAYDFFKIIKASEGVGVYKNKKLNLSQFSIK